MSCGWPTQLFPLLGMSQGAAIAVAYAARHPDRLTHLILYGGWARGRRFRGLEDNREEQAGQHRGDSSVPSGVHR